MTTRSGRDSRPRTTSHRHAIELLLERRRLARRQEELTLLRREIDVEHFPLPGRERLDVSTRDRRGIELRVAGRFGHVPQTLATIDESGAARTWTADPRGIAQ